VANPRTWIRESIRVRIRIRIRIRIRVRIRVRVRVRGLAPSSISFQRASVVLSVSLLAWRPSFD